jgi:hypothetical protein
MKRLKRISYFLLISLMMTVLFSTTGLQVPVKGSSSIGIFPPDSEPYGLSYAEHAQDHWEWVLQIPASDNPINDNTGDKCAVGQPNANSSVFHLSEGEGKVERTCTVPAGKGLAIPLMQVEVSDKEVPGASVEELSTAAKKDQDSVNSLYLRIDDNEYTFDDLLKYRLPQPKVFEVTFPDNGIFGVIEGGPSTIAADGFYVLTEPLTAGNHTVHFSSSLLCTEVGCTEPAYAQDVLYNIVAK